MKPRERRNSIAALIDRDGASSVDALSLRFGVSPETIRRDLARLADEGAVRKVHGGARPATRLHSEASFQERMAEDTDAKRQIAARLVEELRSGDTLFIDTGSTTLVASATLVEVPGLTIITNSLGIAETLGGRPGAGRVYLLGGAFAPGNRQTVGPLVMEQIGSFQADHAILTVAALDTEAAMDSDPDEAAVARAMIRSSSNVIVLATPTKLRRRAAYRVCDLADIDTLICGVEPAPDIAGALARAGVLVK
ncbi:DeoR/GlpR family DNA-binding transcription regulator [Amaricoccus macauensis]|uniref:DeoR/GlpR family DNA-binding transcription regulator n=1 Tax=Amaricoccus macauensis TaxID=57001 RepID=UPI003C7BA6EE